MCLSQTEDTLASPLPSSHLSPKQLENVMGINGGSADLEFRRPTSTKRPDSMKRPWVCFFASQVRSGLRIPPPPFMLNLASKYSIPENQFHPFSIRRAVNLHILYPFYKIEDFIVLIYATHSIKCNSAFYGLSPKFKGEVSFNAHSSIDKDFAKHYFCVWSTSPTSEWLHTWGPSPPLIMLPPSPRDLSEKERPCSSS